ncbi:GGDEF domain-containing protein [Chachezhania antarctica]|uniref:GGDEF domain-containing protein n=1 Tax=Chachezhania antarctica TaxID=2340860 RepID=UPI000EAD87D7|nr:GGDEF domain-containing protein [Chachezhania antarctica]|tara:strand:- start:55 stop:1167 length:1113 start_codon:yes stop_codon:yes gene_type:complete
MIDLGQLKDVIEKLCPMAIWVDRCGHIRHVGPTLQKVCPETEFVGHRALEFFRVIRPRSVLTMQDLAKTSGSKLHMQMRMPPGITLKGVFVELPDDAGAIINLSFGISVFDAVRDFSLSSKDFAPTDQTIELLYLMESKSAAMEASRSLNVRLQGAMIAAEEQAFTDTLTGLKNRRAVNHVLHRLTAVQRPYSLLHLDLDYFKDVNDTLGHAAGDHVLQYVARIMVDETREGDTVARIGGDEFVLIFDGLTDRGQLGSIARRLIDRLEQPITYGGQTCTISASVGIAISAEVRYLPVPGQAPDGSVAEVKDGADRADFNAILNFADVALYEAKRAGRGCFRFFSPDMLVSGASAFMPRVLVNRRQAGDGA